jgi:tRNA G18 (ribose-2'-O)-methylase SpoU
MEQKHKIIVVLHNIRSVHNVGAIFRTAEGVGVSEIWLTGYTPTPLDRFGRMRNDFKKAALGAERYVPWRHMVHVTRALTHLRGQGFSIVGVEQDKRAQNYREEHIASNTCFVFGNEVRGLSPQTLALCDNIYEIPMMGKKESLNVSVAAGIILFHFR